MSGLTERKELEGVARRWLAGGWQAGDPGIVDELHAPDFVDHDPAGRSGDNEGFREGIMALNVAFPDLYLSVEELVVDEAAATVAIRWSGTGTHRGEFMGYPASGRRFRFKGIEIIRIRDERIRERWGEWDGLSLMAQLSRA